MKAPNEYHIDELIDTRSFNILAEINGKWVQARPVGLPGIRRRIALAWDVLVGKADALYWEGQ